MKTPVEAPTSLRQLLRQHLALLLTGFVFVTIGLRVLAATRGNASAALALLQNADPVEVVVGMGIQLLPLLPLLVASIAIYLRESTVRTASSADRRRAVGFAYEAIGVGLLVASLVVPFHWGYLLGVGLGAIVALLGSLIVRDAAPGWLRVGSANSLTPERWELTLRRSRYAMVLLTSVVYLLLALSPTMWLPREMISHGERERTVGFVLKSDFVETVVLESRTRGVVHIRTEDLEHRRICVLKEQERPLLFELLGGDEPDYPRCPSRTRA